MALSGSRQVKVLPASRKKNGSSNRPGLILDVEESCRLKGTSPQQVISIEARVKGWVVPKVALTHLLKSYLTKLGHPGASVSLAFVDDGTSRGLNRRFRKIDGPTDILSFPAEKKVAPEFSGYLGDLVLALPYAWQHRGRFHRRFEGELAFLILHGLLHLLGQHHDSAAQERALWKLQDKFFPPDGALLKALRGLKPKV